MFYVDKYIISKKIFLSPFLFISYGGLKCAGESPQWYWKEVVLLSCCLNDFLKSYEYLKVKNGVYTDSDMYAKDCFYHEKLLNYNKYAFHLDIFIFYFFNLLFGANFI